MYACGVNQKVSAGQRAGARFGKKGLPFFVCNQAELAALVSASFPQLAVRISKTLSSICTDSCKVLTLFFLVGQQCRVNCLGSI